MPSLADLVDEVIQTDVLIAGSEGAGARAAISAHDAGAAVNKARLYRLLPRTRSA